MGVDIMYYNLHDLLTRNKLFNFIISMRGDGKTYSFKDWAIRDFLKNKKEFIYLRRYKSELMDLDKFFSDIKDEYPDHEFKTIGKKFYIDNMVCGYAVQLSNALTKKSVSYPNVNKIGYDEFIIDKAHIRYLPNEVKSFLEYYETVARMRDDVRVIFMGNAITMVNPYFVYFKIVPDTKRRFTIKGDILVDLFRDEEFVKAKYETRFGKLIQGTAYGDYAIENKFLNDNDDFIATRTKESKYQFTIYFKGQYVGVWFDFNSYRGYCTKNYDKTSKFTFTFTDSDFKPNYNLIRNYKDHWLIKSAVELFKDSSLYFDSLNTKTLMYELFMNFNIF